MSSKAKAFMDLVKTGVVVSWDHPVQVLLIIALILLIASVCVPYYTDSAGAYSGVYGSGKDCLGFSGMNCDVIHAFPILTILFVCLTLIMMFLHIGLGPKYPMKYVSSMIVVISLPVAALFAVVTLGTQLGMPLGGTSLADQAKNSTSPTTFKDGMALTATAVALIIFAFLTQVGVIGKIVGKLRGRQ